MDTIRESYEILGLDNNATDDEIKKAYKKLAIKYHPDKNKDIGADEKFKEISNAYQILTNRKEHMTNDKHRSQGFPSHFRGGFVNPDELFKQFFNINPNMHHHEPRHIFHFSPNMGNNINIVRQNSIGHSFKQTSIIVKNGKRIETTITRAEGVVKKESKITELDSGKVTKTIELLQ